ncbi:MAG: hypothetical protein AAFZ63_02405 [Bacteroidota bacterium]
MKIRSTKSEDAGPNALDQFVGYSRKSYRQFSDYVAFREGDPLWMLAYKILLQLIGFAFMLLLSPFLIIGLIIAIAAVL